MDVQTYFMSAVICLVGTMLVGASVYNLFIKSEGSFNIFPNRYSDVNRLPDSKASLILNILMFWVGAFIIFLGVDLALGYKFLRWFA